MKTFCIDSSTSLRELSKSVAQYLQQHEHMETNRFLAPDGECIVHGQVRDRKFRCLVGADKRVVVRMRPLEDGRTQVILDAPAWKDKAAVASLSMVCLWPLCGMAAYGLWDQIALFHRLKQLLQTI